jgi:hypothetical protein
MVMAEEAKIAAFKAWLIERGRVAPTRDEEIKLRRALHRILKRRSARFRALLKAEAAIQQPQPELQPQP